MLSLNIRLKKTPANKRKPATTKSWLLFLISSKEEFTNTILHQR